MRRRKKLIGMTAVVLALIAVPVTLADPDSPAPHAQAAHATRVPARSRAAHRSVPLVASAATATVTLAGGARPVPRSFLGLSMEYWGLPLFERRGVAFRRVLAMLTPPGQGPLLLRVGGDSADRSFWDPGLRRMPGWAFRVMPPWLRLTRDFLRRVDVRLIVDLNLVTSSPVREAIWARAARAALPRGSIAGFEIGNEPDIYDRSYWLAAITRVGQPGAVLPAGITPGSYVRAFGAYARALRRLAPGTPLIGPALANPSRSSRWIWVLARHERPELGLLSAHRYPYSACLGRSSAAFPTVARLLSERASAGNADALARAIAAARAAGLPLRVTELNSVTCGGRVGVSNSFASALWAPDALFELLRAGVAGVNIHVRANAINAAMLPARHGFLIRPLLYGLALFARMFGPHAALAPVRLSEKRLLHLKAWAVRVPSGLNVLLINKGAHPADVALRMSGFASARVERMLAPSPAATAGETLEAQTLGGDGRWHGTPRASALAPGPAGYALALPAASAALVLLR